MPEETQNSVLETPLTLVMINKATLQDMVDVTILNDTGHTELELTAQEAVAQIYNHPTHWAYINGEMIAHEDIANIPLESIESVILTQAIVGGRY